LGKAIRKRLAVLDIFYDAVKNFSEIRALRLVPDGGYRFPDRKSGSDHEGKIFREKDLVE